eukprot:COSAG01_NODE_7665_length_3107_cov_2.577793_3_plen_102_part_00
MGLLAAHWCLPLFSMTLPPCTLYRLWDLLFLEGNKIQLCAALVMMQGTPTDVRLLHPIHLIHLPASPPPVLHACAYCVCLLCACVRACVRGTNRGWMVLGR